MAPAGPSEGVGGGGDGHGRGDGGPPATASGTGDETPRHVVVFGTTDLALRAAERYAGRGHTVDVVAPRFSHGLQMLGEGEVVRLVRAQVQPHSVVQFFEDDPIVVVATGDPATDRMVADAAEEAGLDVVWAGLWEDSAEGE